MPDIEEVVEEISIEDGMRQAIEETQEELDMPMPNPEPKVEEVVEVVETTEEVAVEKTQDEIEADAKAELEAEMDSLGIKAQRSRDRFANMTKDISELKPYKEALDSIGITELSQLPTLVERAKAADTFEQALADTGAPPEDFGMAMDVLRKLHSGDVGLANEAYDALVRQLEMMSPILGRTIEGIDPLTPELREAVNEGDITEAMAIELSANRARKASEASYSEKVAQRELPAQVENQARAELTNFGNTLATQDSFYAEKSQVLIPIIRELMANLPPEKWVQATKDAYARIPNPTPKVVQPLIQNPIRPRSTPTAVVPEGLSAMDAMALGIRHANGEI